MTRFHDSVRIMKRMRNVIFASCRRRARKETKAELLKKQNAFEQILLPHIRIYEDTIL